MANKKDMVQVSVSIRRDKHDFLKAWSDERDESIATICRGWIYTGIADLQDALGHFNVGPQEEPMEVEIPKESEENERIVEETK
jgi:hypothetical protein|tara:strand:- start:4407 stop:4658 length:252 start_codon:yes stop_codon:yes gene_type:complete